MTPKRRIRQREAQIAFESLSIEGGLLSPEWLSKVALLQASGQSEADYYIPKGLNLRDEIGRYWRISQALWAEFKAGLSGSTDRSALAERFIYAHFRDVFGFTAITEKSHDDGTFFSNPLSFYGSSGRIPIVVSGEGLDTPSYRFGDGTRRRSAFALVQEYLNAPQHGLWGMVTDGMRLRLVRENASLTRPTWIEADLERLFTEEKYADFVALWLLIHASRFGKAESLSDDCWLESWRSTGYEDGVRARARLRKGVEAALIALGQGFLSHRDNHDLRGSLADGTLTKEAYFQELLRLVYRLIFLLTIEERGLLHPPDADEAAKQLYFEAYSIRSLRERASRRTARDRFSDLWEALRISFRGAANGEVRLALPALGGLFAEEQCLRLDAAKIENRALLDSVYYLSWLREESGLARVNWRDMGPEELGSIYESLLELLPQISLTERSFHFSSGSEAKGNARKLTSSFYTHDHLVQTLLDTALEPLIERTIAEHPENTTTALLELTILDPACGSGHFLLGAARRLAAHVARMQVNGSPSVGEYREALRKVISHCIYGVDRNPMASELCKTALWIETVVPGRPLSFLDSHIRCGDALLGVFSLALLDEGIPAEAYEARDGDEKAVASELRRENKKRIKGIHELPLFAAATALVHLVEMLPEETLEQIKAKRSALFALEFDPSIISARKRADIFCAAFFARKTSETRCKVPLTSDIDKLAIGQSPRPEAISMTEELNVKHKFFHWPLIFPDIFSQGGFDLVLGNPPWKKLRPDVNEWFQKYDIDISSMAPKAQEQRISELLTIPGISQEWDQYRRTIYDSAAFMKESGRFILFAQGSYGSGEFDVYRMFIELALFLSNNRGFAAQLVPENFLIGANASAIRKMIFSQFHLRTVMHFENKNKIWFSGVHQEKSFCLYVANKGGHTESFSSLFYISTLDALESARNGKMIDYPFLMVHEFSPDTLAISKIAHAADIAITQKIYARFPKFGEEQPRTPKPVFKCERHMGNDRQTFSTLLSGISLYQGSMIDAFDHRAQAYVSGRGKSAKWRKLAFGSPDKLISPQWRIAATDIPEKVGHRWNAFRIGIADEANPNNSRTFTAALIPPNTICGDKVPTIIFIPNDDRLMLLWIAIANSFCSDYLARKKVSMKMSKSVLESLPLPRIYEDNPLERKIASITLRLSATGQEMYRFWSSTAILLGLNVQHDSPCENPAEREHLRAELDVLVARDLFGLTRDEMRYLLEPSDILGPECNFETFGALKRAELRKYREFRTRRLILEAWDTLPSPNEAPRAIARAS